MALPWLIGLGAAAVIGAVIANSDDDSKNSSGGNNDDDEKERKRAEQKAEKERIKAERKAKKYNLAEQFNERLAETQEPIESSVVPYFLMKFNGNYNIKELGGETNEHNFFGMTMQKNLMRPLQETSTNLNYVKKMYDVEITPNIELHYALQEIEDYEVKLQETQNLKQAILQTLQSIK